MDAKNRLISAAYAVVAPDLKDADCVSVPRAAIERLRGAIQEAKTDKSISANEYQSAAARTLIDEPDTTFTNEELAIMLAALELGATVGKVLEYVKKGICHRHGFNNEHLGMRLIDVNDATLKLFSCGVAEKREYHLTGNEQMLIWCALGLGGEAGEVMDTVMAMADPSARDGLVKELGDGLWYNAALCTLIGIPMSDVMQANTDKLRKRFPEGWGSEASKARVDTL